MCERCRWAREHHDSTLPATYQNQSAPMPTTEIQEFLDFALAALKGPMMDGASKRARGEKPSWKYDSHIRQIRSHLTRWELGEKEDADSGCHPLVHCAVRCLMVAWQEQVGVP